MYLMATAVSLWLGNVTSDHPARLYNVNTNRVALDGFDVVGYFDGEAVPGLRANSSAHNGVTYWFSSSERRDRFDENPAPFLPVCGGWARLVHRSPLQAPPVGLSADSAGSR